METGSFYISKKELLLSNNNRLGKKIVPYVMDFITNFEIDTLEDVEIVKWAMKKYLNYKEKTQSSTELTQGFERDFCWPSRGL